tara:strand:+ start:373 stop:699 length:327 start_codon:yes stop_codon:yes gene_type:complete
MFVVSPALTLCLGSAVSIGSNGENVLAWTKRTLCSFLHPVARRLWDHWNYHVGCDGIRAGGLKMVFCIRIQKPALWKRKQSVLASSFCGLNMNWLVITPNKIVLLRQT